MKNIIGVIILATFLGIVAVLVYKQKQMQPVNYQNQISVTQTVLPTQEVVERSNVSVGLIVDITEPSNGLVVSVPQIRVKGKTYPLATVSVNDIEITASTTGDFSTLLTLDEGENIIVVTVNDKDGNYAEKEIIVTYNVPQSN